MREVPLSNCEYEFICAALKEGVRIDRRGVYDVRDIDIKFNKYRGGCIVSLGNTRVLAQVSSELVKPKDSRPNEGILKINLELSPMAAQHFEVGKQSEYGVELNRFLERNVVLSRSLDMESLCLRAGEKVWLIRVDLNVLNYDGNVLDCANIALLSSLSHYRLPEVTFVENEIKILSEDERTPNPLSIIHIPLTVTFAFYDQGKYILVDPNELEERSMDGKLIIGMNKHREICMIQLSGNVLLLKDQIHRCIKIATAKITKATEIIQNLINETK